MPDFNFADFGDGGNGAAGTDNSTWFMDGSFSGDMAGLEGGGAGGSDLNSFGGYALNDQDWLSSIGYGGELPFGWEGSQDNGGLRTDPAFLQYLKDKGLSLGSSFQNAEMGSRLGAAFNGQGQQVGGQAKWTDESDTVFGGIIAALAAAGGGAAAAGIASGAGAGAVATGAASGAGAGLGGGLASTTDYGDVLRGTLTGAVTGGIAGGVDTAGYAGITDPTYARPVNSAVNSGLNTAVRGGNLSQIGQSALTSGVQSGANGMWDNFMSSFGAPAAGSSPWQAQGGFTPVPPEDGSYGAWRNDNAQASMMPAGDSRSYSPELGSILQSFNGGGGGATMQKGGDPYADPSVTGFAAPYDAYADASVSGSMGAPWEQYLRKNGGNLAGMLGSLYMGNRQQNAMGKAQRQADKLFRPNSPYAQDMRQRLERTDAAAGRRSQYGTRETNLAAQLSQMRSNQLLSPQYQQLIGGQQAGLAQMLGPMIQMYNRGGFNGIGQAASSGYDALSSMFGG